MEFKLYELESLFYDIEDIVDYFERSKYSDRRYKLYLSNGEYINYSIPENCIAHLLGINTPYLMATGLFKSKSSFELLKELCDNPYKLHKAEQEGKISYKTLFSEFVINKVASFKENTKVNIFETQFICKYNSQIAYCTNNKNEKYDYVIVRNYKDGKIGILAIVNNSGYFVPMSNQIFDNYESAKNVLDDLIRNQEITLISGIHITNADPCDGYKQIFYLPIDAKLEKTANLRLYKNNFNCIIDTTQELQYFMNKTNEGINNHYDDNDLIDKIVESIKKGELINIEIFRNTKLIKIIESFNDYLCNNQIGNSNSIEETYSTIKKNLEVLKQEFSKLETKHNILEEQNKNLIEINNELNSENEQLKETQNKIYEMIKPRN